MSTPPRLRPLPDAPALRAPWGRLVLLALAVLLVHLAFLRTAPVRWEAPAAQPAAVRLLTRSMPAPAAPPAPAAAAPPRATPPPRRPAVPVPAAGLAAPPAAQAPHVLARNEALPSTPAEDIAIKTEAISAPETAASQTAPPAHALPAASATTAAPVAAKAAGHAPPPVAVAGPVRLRYGVKGQARGLHYSASAELLWLPTGSQYEARLEVSAFLLGSRVQTSSGQLTPEGLAPTRFSDKSRTEQAAHFERAKGRISFSGNTPDVALLPGAQDRLSVVLQLAALLAGDPARYPPGTQIAIQTAGPRDADVWSFTVEGEERLELPGGAQVGTKLVRPPRHEFDQKVELWFSQSNNFLPIRIKLTQVRGDYVDQLWQGSETP